MAGRKAGLTNHDHQDEKGAQWRRDPLTAPVYFLTALPPARFPRGRDAALHADAGP